MVKAKISIENVVASADLGGELPLEKVAAVLKEVEYDPEQFPGMVYRTEKPKTATLVFSSGKLVCTGAKSPSESMRTINYIARKLRSAKVKIKSKPDIQIQNIVASADLGAELNLDAIIATLENTEYEPEQFPGLIYRVRDPKVVILLFGSGKLVCTGAKRASDVSRAVAHVMKVLKSKRLM